MESLNRVQGKHLAHGRGAHPAREHIKVVADTRLTLLSRLQKEPTRSLEPPAEEAKPHRERLVQLLETKAEPPAEEGAHLDLASQEPRLLGEHLGRPLNRPPGGIGGGSGQHVPDFLGSERDREFLAGSDPGHDTHANRFSLLLPRMNVSGRCRRAPPLHST